MTPGDEHHLYQTDHAAWCKHVAPRWAEMLREADAEEKRRLWGIASDGLRDELKRLATEGTNHD